MWRTSWRGRLTGGMDVRPGALTTVVWWKRFDWPLLIFRAMATVVCGASCVGSGRIMAPRPQRRHDGKVAVSKSNQRWCCDGFEFPCDNGEPLRVTFALVAATAQR